jgi:hypothetical protein
MALGIPVICNDGVGDTAAVVKKFKAGHVVEQLNVASYPQDIRQFQDANFDRTAIRKGAKEFYSLEKGVQLYDQVYQSL